MIKHKTLWMLAALCVAVASAIALARYVMDERAAAAELAQLAMLDEVLYLLEVDPGADWPETQRALRRAAVAVDAGEFQNAEGFYLLAQQYVREVDYNQAEDFFRLAIEAAPGWSKPHAGLGRLLSRNAVGRRDEAAKELNTAIELDPEWWDPYDSLAILHRMEGELHAAEEAATRAVELAPYLVGPHNNLANLLVSLKKYPEAEAQYRAAIALDESHAKPYYNLACLYSLMGKKDEALSHLELAIDRVPALRLEAVADTDLKPLRKLQRFKDLVAQPAPEVEEPEAEGESAQQAN